MMMTIMISIIIIIIIIVQKNCHHHDLYHHHHHQHHLIRHHLIHAPLCAQPSLNHMLLRIRKHLSRHRRNRQIPHIRLKLLAPKQHTEEQHGIELCLPLLSDAALAQFIVTRTRSLVIEYLQQNVTILQCGSSSRLYIVRFRQVLEFGVGFGII